MKNAKKKLCLAVSAIICLALDVYATSPEYERQFVCAGREGVPTVVGEKTVGKNAKARGCRPALQREANQRWLCRIADRTILFDYPVAKVGRLPKLGENKNIICEGIVSTCAGDFYLLETKGCYSKPGTTRDSWLQFAQDSNQTLRKLSDECPSEKTNLVFPAARVRTNCLDEACVLHWRGWYLPSEAAATNDVDALAYFEDEYGKSISLSTDDVELGRSLNVSGVYCVEGEIREDDPDLEDLEVREMTGARLVKELPADWQRKKAELAAQAEVPPTASEEAFRCKSDGDCIKLKPRACGLATMFSAPGTGDRSDDPSFTCKCMTGLTLFGCVPVSLAP